MSIKIPTSKNLTFNYLTLRFFDAKHTSTLQRRINKNFRNSYFFLSTFFCLDREHSISDNVLHSSLGSLPTSYGPPVLLHIRNTCSINRVFRKNFVFSQFTTTNIALRDLQALNAMRVYSHSYWLVIFCTTNSSQVLARRRGQTFVLRSTCFFTH